MGLAKLLLFILGSGPPVKLSSLILFTLIYPRYSFADIYERANYKLYFNGEVPAAIERAVLQYESVSLASHNAERWTLDQARYLGFNDATLTTLAFIANTSMFHRISTKSIHFYYSPYSGLTLRPDLVYSYISKEYEVSLTFNWRFK